MKELNSATIRRLILTLATGYLTVFGVRQIPYEFQNEWLVLVPALILVYVLTVWVEGKIFKDDALVISKSNRPKLQISKAPKKGFGSD